MNIDIIENHGYDTKREREEDLIRKEDDCTDMLSLQLSVFKSYQTLFQRLLLEQLCSLLAVQHPTLELCDKLFFINYIHYMLT